jgi:hypothetical protein
MEGAPIMLTLRSSGYGRVEVANLLSGVEKPGQYVGGGMGR